MAAATYGTLRQFKVSVRRMLILTQRAAEPVLVSAKSSRQARIRAKEKTQKNPLNTKWIPIDSLESARSEYYVYRCEEIHDAE